MGKRGKVLNGDARTIILRVMHFFELEKANGGVILPVEQALARTMQATGVSEGTISRIKQEAKKIMDAETKKVCGPVPLPDLTTPTAFRNKRKVYTMNSQQIEALCDTMVKEHSYGEPITFSRIMNVARSDFDFKGGKTTLGSLLRAECGFSYKACQDARHVGKKCWLPDPIVRKKNIKRKQREASSSDCNGKVKEMHKYEDNLLSRFVKVEAKDPLSGTGCGVLNDHDYSGMSVEDPCLKEMDLIDEPQRSMSESSGDKSKDDSDSESMSR